MRSSSESRSSEYRALVCITTCRRLRQLRRYLPHFAEFCGRDRRFSLLVALDGTETETLRFCEAWEIPLVYSDEQEGVGISKNRVLERFGNLDYYFFVEDDVELVDGSVFPAHVELAQATGIHHLSLFERGGIRKVTGESLAGGRRIVHGMFGGGQFGFYTGAGLREVGGWHPRFATDRRWGHTEHSYRFFRIGLAPAPFNVAEGLAGTCIWHYPPPVTRLEIPTDEDQIVAAERSLIDQGLRHVPVQTLSPHHFNDIPLDRPARLSAVLKPGARYPLVPARERRQCKSDYHLWRFRQVTGVRARAGALAAAAWNWPANPALRHTVKTAWPT